LAGLRPPDEEERGIGIDGWIVHVVRRYGVFYACLAEMGMLKDFSLVFVCVFVQWSGWRVSSNGTLSMLAIHHFNIFHFTLKKS
jgi:hypothetical protein